MSINMYEQMLDEASLASSEEERQEIITRYLLSEGIVEQLIFQEENMKKFMVMPGGERKEIKSFSNGDGFILAKPRGTSDRCLYNPKTEACTTTIVSAKEIDGELYVLTVSGSIYWTGPSLDVMSKVKLISKFGGK